MRPDYPMYNEDGEINTIDFYTKNPLVEAPGQESQRLEELYRHIVS